MDGVVVNGGGGWDDGGWDDGGWDDDGWDDDCGDGGRDHGKAYYVSLNNIFTV